MSSESKPEIRSSGTRRAGVAAMLLAAAFAVWAGWHFVHRRGAPQAADQGNPPVESAGAHAGINGIRNVLLVSIDTCRADRLSCYGRAPRTRGRRSTTPNIDAVAQDGALFEMALTPVPVTTPAHSSMLTGTWPPTHGVRLNTYDHLAASNVTLAKMLREAGYQTAAFVGGFPLDSRFGLNQGFDTYDGRFADKNLSKRAAEDVSRPALAWLEDHAQKPFFLFLHYYDAHYPYEPHPPYTSPYADDPYTGEIAYIDHCIGLVLDWLRARGLQDNTLVIITGDHGEGLGEHGEIAHGFFIYQSTLRVPLVIRAPGRHVPMVAAGGTGLRFDGNVSLVDIVPTVLDLLGLEIPARVEGVSLRAVLDGVPVRVPSPASATQPQGRGAGGEGEPRAVYAESLEAGTYSCSPLFAIIQGPWKYILAPRQELYDLSRDPGERTNLASQQPQVVQRLRGRLEQMLKQSQTAASRRGRAAPDPEAVRRLQSLGYLSGGHAPPVSFVDAAREDPKDFLATYQRLDKAWTLFLVDHRNEEARKELLEIAAGRPGLVLPHQLLAGIAMAERRLADAAEQYAKVVAMLDELKDSSRRPLGAMQELATAHFGSGLALQQMGKLPEAVAHYEQALRINPDYASAHLNLGQVLQQMGKLPEAVAHYEQALRINPDYAEAHLNLGSALQRTGKLPEAIAHYEQVVRIRPDFADAHYNLASALQRTGNLPEAAAHYEQALRIQPEMAGSNPSLLKDLAWIRATSEDPRLRDGPEAVRLAQRAVQLTGGKDPAAWDVLAAAFAEAGRFAEAVKTARTALDLANERKNQSLAKAIQLRFQLYQAGAPFRAAPSPTVYGR